MRLHPPLSPIWSRSPRTFSLMGIVNVTPDSFSDGGLHFSHEAAISHGLQLADEGADILDIGGESTRPGALMVDEAEELRRVIPVIEALAGRTSCLLSVDTRKAAVAETAARAGATIINDISALRDDPRMLDVLTSHGLAVVLMHMQGDPATMQRQPSYRDVVAEVHAFLTDRIALCRNAGVQHIAVDPGIGFGKRHEDNLLLMRQLADMNFEDVPLVIGTSRKSFLGRITGVEVHDRVPETIASCVAAYAAGAHVFRVHDIGAVRRALLVAEAIATCEPGVPGGVPPSSAGVDAGDPRTSAGGRDSFVPGSSTNVPGGG